MNYRHKPIQLNNQVHTNLKEYCNATGKKMCEVAEEAITNYISSQKVLKESREQWTSKAILEMQMKEYIKTILDERQNLGNTK